MRRTSIFAGLNLFLLCLFISPDAHAKGYDWCKGVRGIDGTGDYCFKTKAGKCVGISVDDEFCSFRLKLANNGDGWGCYILKPNGELAAGRRKVGTSDQCATEFDWARSRNGSYLCFALNDQGEPVGCSVEDKFCR